MHCVKLWSLIQSHANGVQWVCSEAENCTMVAIVKCLGLNPEMRPPTSVQISQSLEGFGL